MIALHLSSGLKTVTGIAARTSGGLKTVTEAYIREADGLKSLLSAYHVDLSATDVSIRRNSAGTVTLTTASVTATPDGGVPPYSHAWTRVSPDAHAWTITNPTAASTTFSTTADPETSWEATFIDTVTDAAGQVLASAQVNVTASNDYFHGGFGFGGGGGPYP